MFSFISYFLIEIFTSQKTTEKRINKISRDLFNLEFHEMQNEIEIERASDMLSYIKKSLQKKKFLLKYPTNNSKSFSNHFTGLNICRK